VQSRRRNCRRAAIVTLVGAQWQSATGTASSPCPLRVIDRRDPFPPERSCRPKMIAALKPQDAFQRSAVASSGRRQMHIAAKHRFFCEFNLRAIGGDLACMESGSARNH